MGEIVLISELKKKIFAFQKMLEIVYSAAMLDINMADAYLVL